MIKEEREALIKKFEECWESLDEDSIQKILEGYATISKNITKWELDNARLTFNA